MYAQRIKSDSGDGFYVVHVHRGKAQECSCPSFRYRGRCKHMERAELVPDFVKSRAQLLNSGMGREEFKRLYESLRKHEGVTTAIRTIIAKGKNTPAKECTRCYGEGVIPEFIHVANGVCFRCWGSGIEITPQEREEAKREYHRKHGKI